MRLTAIAAILPLLLLPTWPVPEAHGCFAVIVGRAASADGSVLLGHNEQNSGRPILSLRRVPGLRYAESDVVRLHRGGELPQVEQTWGLLWSEMPGREFSDTHLNEWGVAVTSDQCQTREDDYDTLEARGQIRQGGIGYMFRRLVALRARSAREGVELAGRLIERFGYVDSGRTYVIADPREAWLLGVVRGRHWVAQRVPDDAVVLLPNVHIIGQVDLDDTDHFLGSADLIDYAVGRGWYDANGGEPFSFRRAYNKDRNDPPDVRRWRARGLVSGEDTPWPPKEPPPLGIRPKRKLTVADVAEILRNTSGPGRPLSSPRTQECAIFQLRTGMPPGIGCIYWRTSAEPAVSVLVPWYVGITSTPRDYHTGGDIKTRLTLDRHFNPPQGTFDPNPLLAFWTFLTLQDVVHEDYDNRIKPVQRAWSAFEQQLFSHQPSIEKEALRLWKTDPNAARAHLTRYSAETAARARRQAELLIATLRR